MMVPPLLCLPASSNVQVDKWHKILVLDKKQKCMGSLKKVTFVTSTSEENFLISTHAYSFV